MSQPTLPLHVSPPGTGQPLGAGDQGHAPATVIDSAQLLQGRKEVVLMHQGQPYRLQLTRAGKLILTK